MVARRITRYRGWRSVLRGGGSREPTCCTAPISPPSTRAPLSPGRLAAFLCRPVAGGLARCREGIGCNSAVSDPDAGAGAQREGVADCPRPCPSHPGRERGGRHGSQPKIRDHRCRDERHSRVWKRGPIDLHRSPRRTFWQPHFLDNIGTNSGSILQLKGTKDAGEKLRKIPGRECLS